MDAHARGVLTRGVDQRSIVPYANLVGARSRRLDANREADMFASRRSDRCSVAWRQLPAALGGRRDGGDERASQILLVEHGQPGGGGAAR